MAARDIAFIAAILFVSALVFFSFNFIMNTAYDEISQVPEVNESDNSMEVFQTLETTANRLDYVFLGVFIALLLSLIISSYFVGGHPIFMFVYFIVVVIVVVISPVLSNVWETATQNASFGLTVASMPITNHILLLLPYYMVAIAFIGIVTMFASALRE